ncbi:KS-MAT linker domain-containing protein, partial [Myxococcus vastator]|uniref:KS-MAT linker domain-containing protein n=1 Tax=Myxococcus vastator TaxID=2709664 RepID=UPI00196849D8
GIVLSARTPERLRARARQLLDALDAQPAWGADALESLAFTLQRGREAMAARLAFVAEDLATCRERLRTFATHAADPTAPCAPGLFTATIAETSQPGAAPTEAALLELVGRNEHEAIARAWVEGTPWPWEALYREHPPRRVSLPTYPFVGERYWIETTAT